MPDDHDADRAARIERALQLAREADSFQAVAFLESRDDALAVGQDYSELVRSTYADKNVAGMISLGLAGIHFCLAAAQRRLASEPEHSSTLKGLAKTIAYNLGANTWPGWNDEGIVLGATDLAIGMHAARLNLRLARELARGPDALGNAHWLIGAHLLAAQQTGKAIAAFGQAERDFQQSGKSDYALMAAGYAALARKTAASAVETLPSAREHADRQLQTALQALEQHESPDARFFAEQIRTAEMVLRK
jgi:hypothetical protein